MAKTIGWVDPEFKAKKTVEQVEAPAPAVAEEPKEKPKKKTTKK